jgi:hypothetical protein
MNRFRLSAILVLWVVVVTGLCLGCGDDDSDDSAGNDDDSVNDDDDDETSGDDDDSDNDDDDDDNDTGPEPPQFLFNLTPGNRNLPYPSDIFTSSDATSPTGIRIDLSGGEPKFLEDVFRVGGFFLRSLKRIDGFSPAAPIWFPVSDEPDPKLLPDAVSPSAEDTAFCVVLDSLDASHEGEYLPMDVVYLEGTLVLQMIPRFPLVQKSVYGCAITSALKTKFGEDYAIPDHLAYVMADSADTNHPLYETLEPIRQAWQPLLEKLAETSEIAPEDLVAVDFFTTQWLTHDLVSVREQLEQIAIDDPPTVTDWTIVSRNDPNVDSVWDGRYDTIKWRRKGVLDYDESGDPLPTGTESVTLRLTLPSENSGYSPPYPVVVFSHGINGDRDQQWPLAKTLAKEGFATVSIDFVFHGDRVMGLSETLEWWQSIQFLNLFEPLKLRDNFRQGVADLIWLKHVIRGLSGLDLAPQGIGGDGVPDLETGTIYFSGMSLGSIHCGVLAAIEPDIDTYFLNTGAAEFKSIVLEGWVGEILVSVLDFADLFVEGPMSESVQMFFDVYRPMIDAGDPYGYGRHVIDEPLWGPGTGVVNILHQMAAFDETLGGPGSGEMARSMGLVQLEPFVWQIEDVETTVLPYGGPSSYQFDTDTHGFLLSSGDETYPPAHRQAAAYFRSAYDHGIATIIDPFAP